MTAERVDLDAEWTLAEAFLECDPPAAARILERRPREEAGLVLTEARPAAAGALLLAMDSTAATECLIRMDRPRAARILVELPLDDAGALLRRLDVAAREALLGASPADLAKPLRRNLAYPEGTAGALMDPQVLALSEDVTAGEALHRIQRSPHRVHYYLYVVDRHEVLLGVLNLRELMLMAADAPLATAMRRNVLTLPADATRSDINAHIGWKELHALPVIDERGVFLGVIRYKTLRRLELEAQGAGQGPGALRAFLSVGEVYWTGVFGLLSGAIAVSARANSASASKEKG